jgi:protein-tyrosine phosphatase
MKASDPAVLRVNPAAPEPRWIRRAAACLARGELVIVPTDTVYGIAAAPAAVARLFEAKGRDREKPIPYLAAGAEAVLRAGAVMGRKARWLATRYWPGPLTLVLPLGCDYEGFRVPDHLVMAELLTAAGGMLRVTSANQSGEPPAVNAQDALAALAPHVSLVLDAGPAQLGTPSTVVKVVGNELQVLREGAIPAGEVLAQPLVLFVCTGNVCRSPMAEGLCRQWLGPDGEWEVGSAGIAAFPGMPASPEAVRALAEKGGDLLAHRSRPLTRALVDAAALIVVMTRAHRQAILQAFPDAAGKVMLLAAFGVPPTEEDIPDPIGSPLDVYRAVRDRINALLPDLVLHLHEVVGGKWLPGKGSG